MVSKKSFLLLFVFLISSCAATEESKIHSEEPKAHTDNPKTLVELRDDRLAFASKCLEESKVESNAELRRCMNAANEKYPIPEPVSGLALLIDCMAELSIDTSVTGIERYFPEEGEVQKIQSCVDEKGKYVVYRIDWKGFPLNYLRKWQAR